MRGTAKPLTASQVEAQKGDPMPQNLLKMPGMVTARPGETIQAWKTRCRIAQNVQFFGIRVRCSSCGARGRHYVEKSGPLYERACPKCDKRTLKRTNRRAEESGAAV